MTFTYIHTNTAGETIPEVFDTESSAVRNVLNWIATKINSAFPRWRVSATITQYVPTVPDTIGGKPGEIVSMQGNVFFPLPEGTIETDYTLDGNIVVDLRQACKNPEATVIGIIIGANLGIPIDSIGKYEDPDANKPAPKDWEVPGARIGQPLASTPNHFTHKGDGGRIGDTWTGASGRRYELTMVGTFAFFKFPAWKGL